MKLVIVESPSKSKTISKYLGDGFVVRASVGHVRDLPKSNKKAIDIPGGFIPHYEIVPKKKAVIAEIRKEAAKAEEILLATDPDREGEAIAWHIKELLTSKTTPRLVSPLGASPFVFPANRGKKSGEPSRRSGAAGVNESAPAAESFSKIPQSKIKRITYHEITKEAVLDAIEHPRAIDEHLREAQEARRVLDRIVGYDLSGLIWKKVRYGLSAGRVQSPALRIIVEREREIKAFKPETYWIIAGNWKTTGKVSGTNTNNASGGSILGLTCSEEPRDKKEVDRIIEIAKKEPWHIVDIEESEQKRSPRAPFITSTLQQTASSRFGLSPSRTMGIAQKLYEAGHITYMRTDSTILSKQALGQIALIVEKEYGKNYLQFRTYAAKSKNAQEAHEAIRPSHFEKMSAGMNDEQRKLYRLIWQRAVASQMADAKVARTKIVANVGSRSGSASANSLSREGSPDFAEAKRRQTKGETPSGEKEFADAGYDVNNIPDFTATGSRVIFYGWLKADPESNGEEVSLPKCVKGEKLELQSIDSLEKQTQPPPRYTEAGLIKELEKRGIGRPSTYASITKTIEDRGYVEKEGRSLKATDTGEVVSTFLEENFPAYVSDTFTAEMEDKLDDIALGAREYLPTLKEFYGPFEKDVKAKEKTAKITTLGPADPKYKCPKCSSIMEIKLGRSGKFISCSRYPDCDGALTIDGVEFKKDEPIGNDPATGLPIFVLNGRFGPYVQLGVKDKSKKKPLILDPAPLSPREVSPFVFSAANRGSEKSGELPRLNGAADADSQKTKLEIKLIKPRMASIPKTMDPSKVTVADALKYLSLPRTLGIDQKTGKEVVASMGRFGPYVVRDGDFRSIKIPDDVYDITLERALEILAVPKAARKGRFGKKK